MPVPVGGRFSLRRGNTGETISSSVITQILYLDVRFSFSHLRMGDPKGRAHGGHRKEEVDLIHCSLFQIRTCVCARARAPAGRGGGEGS